MQSPAPSALAAAMIAVSIIFILQKFYFLFFCISSLGGLAMPMYTIDKREKTRA
jgi:hypothetical protein